MKTFNDIEHGDRVTFLVHAGIGRNGPEHKEAHGTAVMLGPAGWVCDMGGPHGQPGICTLANFVRVKKKRSRPGYAPSWRI